MTGQLTHGDFDRPVNYTAVTLPDSADGQVAATIAMMRRYAVEDSKRPEMVQVLNDALAETPDVVEAAYAEVQKRMFFQRDEVTGEPFGNDVVEVLLRPIDVLLLSETYQVPGDCDCQAMFLASLLLAGGVPCAFCTVGANPMAPERFSHVYVVAYPDTDRRIALDASHGKYTGWEVPDVGRYHEWPLTGAEVGAGSAVNVLLLLLLIGGIWLYNDKGAAYAN